MSALDLRIPRRNKHRLYIAFYIFGEGRMRPALFLTPKDPDPDSTELLSRHMYVECDTVSGHPRGKERQWTYCTASITNRPPCVVSLIFLGKVCATPDAVDEVLSRVTLPHSDVPERRGGSTWCQWAINALVEHRIIAPVLVNSRIRRLAGDLGEDFWRGGPRRRAVDAVPTISWDGKMMKAGIRRVGNPVRIQRGSDEEKIHV